MSLVKLASKITPILEGITNKLGLKGASEWVVKHPHAASSIALTGGIGIADAGTEAAFAKPGQRLKAAKKGLGRGLVYGGILSGAEMGIGKVLASSAGKTISLPDYHPFK